MLIAIFLVVLFTLLPLMVAVGATNFPFTDFDDGFFARIGEAVVGKFLGIYIVFASAVSCVAMFLSEMSSDSFQLMGMAERGMLPEIFSHRSRYGTPWVAILFSATGIVALSLMSLLEIVELLNFLYVLATLIEFAAFIKLRFAHPELHRPFRIPLGNFGVCVMLMGPMFFLAYVLFMAPFKTWAICGAATCVGCGLYYVLCHPVTRQCCKFLAINEEFALSHEGGGEEQGTEDEGTGRGFSYGSNGDYVAALGEEEV